MKRKIKIVFVVHEGALSGANLCLLEYIQLLSKNDFEIYLITPRLGELTEAAAQYVAGSHEIYYYGWTIRRGVKTRFSDRLKKIMRNQFAQWQIRKIVKKIKPAFVATNTITIDVAALVSRRLKMKHVWFVHEFGEQDHGFTFKKGMDFARKKILSLSEKVVVNSKAVLHSFPHSDKIQLVYNSVSNRSNVLNDKTKESEFQLMMLGQIAEGKNQEEAIKAISLCRKQGFPFILSVYGKIINQEYGDFLKELIQQNNLFEFVKIHSPIKNIGKPFSESHALLMCSRNEAFGRVTVEALKAGLPVIAANKGGSIEIVNDGVNGFLYVSGDSNDLAKKIIMLYQNYSDFKHKKIATATESEFNETNTWKQLKEVFS